MKITPESTVGIIGGTGKTASHFARLFRSRKFRVRVTGASTKHRNAALIQSCDIVIFALPLSSVADSIRRELKNATRKDQLILDVSSLKIRETKAMQEASGEVIGMHPLFGPSTDPKGERIIICPVRASAQTLNSLKAILRVMSLKVSVMTPEEHDRLMGIIQVVPHLKSFLMADVLRSLQTDLASALKNCTPIYEMEFNVLGRFLDDNPDLYIPIIFSNPRTVEILQKLKKLVDTYLRIATTSDFPQAEARYRACKKAFQPHLKRARSHSEACIQTLLTLSR